ncbi:uncharacterized protein N7511_000737 [Penicillium nucicola]|uniref:uncharacterized protein n=1 Tax=Penicillium nucicola TaxID=1850975 RepID=UPI002545B1A5|nr:uncharacterized protein N7511_000737 [Penicillium nucicola]KAJ5775726.1 hypothetical protein N7511_000737 [Penicillium nucicola]
MEGLSSIKWGAYREGARFQLPRFDSLNPEGPALLEAYQDVLDKDETFTQYFCDERLQSYELESNLRQLLGIRPPLVDEPESSNNQNDVSISWINIFRHGKFEKTDDDFYQCRMQGRLVKIDETMHKAILVNRCFLPPNTNPWVSAADVTKECEVNVSIEGDILNELHRQMKYVERLKRLQQSLKKRRYRLRRDQGPEASSYKSSDTPQSFRSNYPSPTDSSQKLSVLSRTAIDSQHKSRVSTSVEPSVDLMNPTVSVEYPDEQGRSASPSSSDASTGVDIPFSRNQNNRKRKSMSSDLEQTVDEGWSSQNQTPLPHDTSTPFISASKKTKLAASEENTTMVNGVDAAAKSRTPVPSNKSAWLASVPKEYQPAAANSHTMNGNGKTVSESRDTMGEGRSAVDKRKGAMDISPAETPKPMTPTQRAKQPAPNHATPPKSKRALNGVASSLRQEYENAGQPIDITSSRASTPGLSQEAMRLGSEMAGWQEGFTPVQPRPKLATTKTKTKPKTKEPKKGVRVRNNFTQEEFDFAPAWLKPRFEAGISPAQLEQEYEARFGVLHRHNTLKLWLDRQEAKSGVVPTKIVVLKFRSHPLRNLSSDSL